MSEWTEARRLSLGLARRLVREPEEAEDIAQEAVLRAWRHRHRLRDPLLFEPWLARIVRREAARRTRKARAIPVAEIPEELSVDHDPQSSVELGIDVGRALASLNERERLLIWLRYREDMTQPAIAARLGMPEGTVKVLLHRARDKLRRSLGGT
jgi:RNA polymerase sigma-70 factor, ECF subfamily